MGLYGATSRLLRFSGGCRLYSLIGGQVQYIGLVLYRLLNCWDWSAHFLIGVVMNPQLRRLLQRSAPSLYWRFQFTRWKPGHPEQEISLIPGLCNRNKIAIDVGASMGTYVWNLLPYASAIYAFEPNPVSVVHLIKSFTGIAAPPVTVLPFALSSANTTAMLRIPTSDSGLATIESRNLDRFSESVDAIPIVVLRLDDFNLSNVGFVKIDVEGHESDVLVGARRTIMSSRPTLLIEIEERHRPGSIKSVTELLAEMQYSGFFLLEESLLDVSQFVPSEYQNPDNVRGGKKIGRYINNFIFLPEESAAHQQRGLSGLLRKAA